MNTPTYYQEILLDHYKNPRNRGSLEKPDLKSSSHNPSCGDTILLEALVENNTIVRAVFSGAGCVISQATASQLTCFMLQKPLVELEKVTAQDILALVGIELGPLRARCALLSLEALQEAIKVYKKNHA